MTSRQDSETVDGRRVLVTGGSGSVGRILVPAFLECDPAVVRILDNYEPGLSRLKSQLEDDRCRFLLGDVRDKERLERAMQDIDLVVHAAAMKHVDISEYNPFEAVKTNVIGLQNVVDAAIDGSVERLVFTSSDKSVQPANTMGATKLLGEKLVTAGNKYSGRSDLRLASVRFGNVLGSSGSVVPVFHQQIADGGPVRLTDDRMTRFFITDEEVTNLVFRAFEDVRGGEVFVHEMAAVRIADLAEAMIRVFAPRYDYDPDEIEVETVGRRVGETLHEEIMSDREAGRATRREEVYAIPPETGTNGYLTHDGIDGYERDETIVRSSSEADQLTVERVTELLDRTEQFPP